VPRFYLIAAETVLSVSGNEKKKELKEKDKARRAG
jgi:hypothetical protein